MSHREGHTQGHTSVLRYESPDGNAGLFAFCRMAEFGLKIDVRHNMADFLGRLTELEREHVPFVTAYALTKTAQDIKRDEVEVMLKVFDRPTRFTLNSLFMKPATKRDLVAMVYFKEGFGSIPAWRYLGPQVEGGGRKKKSHERAFERAGILQSHEFIVPGKGVKLDAFGNMRGGEITRILSALGANPDPLSNSTSRSRKRNARVRRYFVLRGHGQAPDGVYERKGTGIVPVMVFVSAPRYEKRFPFFETARATYNRVFAGHFREGWRRYAKPRPRRSMLKAA